MGISTAWGSLNRLRLLPDFFILGAQKAGTTSLHHYLIQHPHVRMPMIKEVHFFDEQFANGINWYRQYFPTFLPKLKSELIHRKKFVYGESTPYYLFHPLVPQRVLKTCPNARFIVLLKNPIDRAYSHYQHERKRGFEPLKSFEAAIEVEVERIAGEEEKICKDSSYNSFSYMHHSYLSRGRYAEQLQQWFRCFPRERFLILEAEYFYLHTMSAFKDVLEFLEIQNFEEIKVKKYNTNQYQPMSAQTRTRLENYFEPYNQDLSELLGKQFSWCSL